jgi:aerobic carbon-monoxide dehydrogenase medium subunit
MYDFELKRPTTTAEAVAALKAEGAQALSGGQTLIPTLKARLAMPEVLVSLTGIAENRYVRAAAGMLAIGGATPHAQVAAEAASAFPALAFLASHIGDPAVRNRGTLGGSVANNDPAADYPAAVLACGATVLTNAREIAAEDYFQGMFATALDEGEIVTGVRFPIPQVAHYQKFYQPASRFALVGVFLARYPDHVGVAVTGAANEGVFRWPEAEAALAANFSASAIEALPPPDPAGMIHDLHGTAAYRAHLVKVLTARAVTASALS